MNQLISSHLLALKRACSQLLSQPFGSLFTLVMLAMAMTLPLCLYLGIKSSEPLLGKLTEAPQLTVFIEMDADQIDIAAIEGTLKERTDLEKIQFVPKDKALKDLQNRLGQDDLITLLEENPLPDAFIITPKDFEPKALQSLQKELNDIPMVQAVQVDTQWAETLFNIVNLLKQLTLFLAVTLGLAFVLVAHNTIRLQILTHKEEIEITRLLGAPASFIRRPFLYQAALQGILACLLSLTASNWIASKAEPMLNKVINQYSISIKYQFFDLFELLFIFAIIIILATIGAYIATSQHLNAIKTKT